ncbi:MAG: hypothetical protein IT581_10145 [Verrucomicrobiales bacterium]|nr:hypothetical protein [Verrucomicrobiales bacterium]
MYPRFERVWAWGVTMVSSVSCLAAAPKLNQPTVTESGVQLRLQGDAGATYRFEASTNLTAWTVVGSGVAQGGVLSTQHAGPALSLWTFYRAVEVSGGGGGASFPTVVATPLTNAIATALLLPNQEASIRVQDARQVVYTLSFPTGAVSEPTLVRLSALETVAGLPNAAGLMAGARLEPAGLVTLAPGFLRMDFPKTIEGTKVASFGFDQDGTRLHLVPDVVVSNPGTNRVRVLVNQLRCYGCGLFTLAELQAQAATIPPSRAGARPALQNDLAGCYPEDEDDARDLQETLEDKIRPRQQAAAAILGEERQKQLLGVSGENEGSDALIRVMADADDFYKTEIESRVPQALEKCATTRTLIPWALGIERQRQLLGGGDGSGTSASIDLICQGAKKCQEQAVECCRTQGGDTRLIQTLLGIERQRALLGAGAECGEISLAEVTETCAPDWYGTLTITVSGKYLNLATNGSWRIQRTKTSDYTVTAQVLSARVRVNEASIFSPAYTNLTFKLGGRVSASERMAKIEENRGETCGGEPSETRRDTWDSSADGEMPDIDGEAVLMAPDASSLFVKPYLRVSDSGVAGDMRWFYEEVQRKRSEFSDEDCETSVVRTGGNYDEDAVRYGVSVFAEAKDFAWTADTIRYTFKGPEPMRFDFEHLFDGLREVTLELHRVK